MFRTETGTDTIQLAWKTKKYEIEEFEDKKGKKQELIKVQSEIYKPSTVSLKDFIIEYYQNRTELGELMVDFMVNGVSFGDWFSTLQNKIGIWGTDHKVTILYSFNGYYSFEDFRHIGFHFQKALLKQILGQTITYNDVLNIYHNVSRPTEMTEERYLDIQKFLKEENEDVLLYCCGMCGDRDCGGFDLKIEQKEDKIIWILGSDYKNLVFDKQQYLDGFGEYIDFINTELRERNIEQVTIL